MLAGAHIAVGAMVGREVKRAWLAVPLAFVSHFVVDAIPHAWLSVRESNALLLKSIILTIDGLIGLALVYWIMKGQPHKRLIIACALAALLPDFMNPVTPVGVWLATLPVTGWLIAKHHAWSWHVPFDSWFSGYSLQVVVFIVIAIVMWIATARRKADDKSTTCIT